MGLQTMLEKRRKNARLLIDGIGASRLPGELFAENFSAWSGLSGDIPGPVFLQRAEMIGELFPGGLKFVIYETVAEGDLVALRCASQGTLFDGTEYRNEYHYQLRFDADDRIVHLREYMDVKVAAEVIRPALGELLRRKAQS